MQGSFHGSFKILKDLIWIFQRPSKDSFKDPVKIFVMIFKDLIRILLGSLWSRSWQDLFKILKDLMRIFQRPSKDPFKNPIEIFASSLRIWLESYNDPSQDLCKIFSKILQDPQGFKEDLLKTFKESFKGHLSRVLLRSSLRSFRIQSESYKDPSQDLCKIYSTILQDPQGIKKDLPKIFKRFIS